MSIIIPVPSQSCPGLDSGASVVGSIPIIGGAASAVATIGGMASTITGWIGDPSTMARDIGGWFTFNLFGYNPSAPDCYQPTSTYGLARSVMLGDVNLSGSTVYHDCYQALAGVGFVLVFLAAMVRVVRMAQSADHDAMRALVDIVPRVLIGLGGIELGYSVLALLLPLASELGRSLLGTLSMIALGSGTPLSDPLGAVLFSGVTTILQMGLLALALIPVLLFFLIRIIALLITRFLIVSLAIAFTPVIIAIAVYDHHNHVVRWWLGLMAGAIITPIVCAGTLGITLGLSMRLAEGDSTLTSFEVGPFVGSIVAIGGLWLSGRGIRASLFAVPGAEHPGMVSFAKHAAGMAMAVPNAAIDMVKGGAAIAAGAASGGAAAAGGAGGGIGAAMGSASPLGALGSAALKGVAGVAKGATAGVGAPAPPAPFGSFQQSSAGAALATAATPSMPSGTSPEARWSHLTGHAQHEGAVDRLRTATDAEAVRSGSAAPAASEQQHFLSSVLSSTPAEVGS